MESRQESGAVTEEKEPVSEPESELEPIIESEPEKPAEPKRIIYISLSRPTI